MSKNFAILSLKIPLTQMSKLRTDPQFILVMRLCRYLNQLNFCHTVYLDYKDDLTPVGIRQTHNAFFFWCAVLYEAVKIVPELGKEFIKFKSFNNGFGTFSKDTELNELKQKQLNKIRNNITFQVGNNAIEETLKTLDLQRYDLMKNSTSKYGDIHFSLADEIALNFMVGFHDSDEAQETYYRETLTKIMNVTVKFIDYANHLINEYVERKHWKVEEIETS